MNWTKTVFLIVLVAATQARAFVMDVNPAGQRQRWNLLTPVTGLSTNLVNPNTQSIRYFLASDAFSTTNTAAELNAVRASFAQWQSVPGTHLKFEDAGLVAPGVDINTSDGTNVVFWVKNADGLINGGLDHIYYAFGITFTSYDANNTLLEADIVFNGCDLFFDPYKWFTDITDTNGLANYLQGGSPPVFIEGVALHEIGHLIGLKHSTVGGATMLWSGPVGVNSWAGLSSDEIAAARALYPAAISPVPLGHLKGTITMNGTNVFGAVVTAEDSAGNVAAGTVSRTNGVYELPALPVGSYQVRVTPLDNPLGGYTLITGLDISTEVDANSNNLYDAVETNFLPTTNTVVAISNGTTNTLDFIVTSGPPAFWISLILVPDGSTGIASAAIFRPGQSNVLVGVLSQTAPGSGLTLTVTGDGVTVGATTVDTNSPPGFTQIAATIGIASNATPGLRSFVIQQNGTNVAYANGFLEISPLVRDDNFDGLDDLFQRKYFPLFTAPQAGPGADPDGDGFNNLAEYIAGTNPTNPASLLQIQSVAQNGSGSTITWQSVAGKKYQVFSRTDFSGATWQTVGSPVTANGTNQLFLDTSAKSGFRFYRVQVLP